jgi:hypothetical protein
VWSRNCFTPKNHLGRSEPMRLSVKNEIGVVALSYHAAQSCHLALKP